MSVVLVSVLLWAQAAPTPIAEAQALLDKLEYSRGLAILERVLERGDLETPDRLTALAMAAVAYSARGEPNRAEEAYFAALRLDPDFELPSGISPKMADAFAKASARHRSGRPTGLTVDATPDERHVAIRGGFDDPEDMVAAVTIRRRPGEDGRAIDTLHPSLERDGARRTFRASLSRPARGDVLAVDVSLDAASGDPLLVWGEPSAPNVVEFPTTVREPVEESPAVYERWWFWTAVGVAAAGVAVTATVLATRDDDLLGRIEVP